MKLNNLIGSKWSFPRGKKWKVVNPADGTTVLAEAAVSTQKDVSDAVAAAAAAFPAWRDTPVIKRCRILMHFKELLEERMEELAECLVKENGKLLAEARGDLRRGLEVVEFAAGMPSLAKGDFIEDIAKNIDGYNYREPLGVVVGITPFNFPAMIPLWMLPVAIACGNTFILKPSDKCPMTATKIVEIFLEAGLPEGVLNVIHGRGEASKALIEAEEVAAVSFVGSTAAATAVWKTGTGAGKRVQALGGAKNYLVVMPDADPAATVKAIMGSAFGCAGERCMATSVLVTVGDCSHIVNAVVKAAQSLRLGDGLDKNAQMGPLITGIHKKNVEAYIEKGISEGADLLLDGRNAEVKGLEKGHFLGASIFNKVKPNMTIVKEEIFGPVLSVMQAETLEQAIELANRSNYGNGASIFTASGGAAHRFRKDIQCGMIGINAGVPAPMAFFSFGGHKESIFGDLKTQGTDSVEFYTKKKAVIVRWIESGASGSVWGK